MPCRFIRAEIGGKRFLAPRDLGGIDDRREGGDAGVAAGIFERHNERAVAAHRVAADGAAFADAKLATNKRGQFVTQVIVHSVVRRPGRLGGVQVEAGALSEIVTVVVGRLVTARAGIRHHQRDAQLGGNALGARLGGKVLIVTGQPRQPVQHRRRRFALRR